MGVNTFMEALESRMFLSAAPLLRGEPNPVIQDDLAQIQADLKQLRADEQAAKAAMSTAARALQAAMAEARAAVREAEEVFKGHLQDAKSVLDADRAAVRQTQETWAPILKADRVAVLEARNDPAALAAARAKLEEDNQAMRAELTPLLTSLREHEAAWGQVFKADRQRIQAVREATRGAVDAARQQMAETQQQWRQTLASDREVLKADIEKLRQDRQGTGGEEA